MIVLVFSYFTYICKDMVTKTEHNTLNVALPMFYDFVHLDEITSYFPTLLGIES